MKKKQRKEVEKEGSFFVRYEHKNKKKSSTRVEFRHREIVPKRGPGFVFLVVHFWQSYHRGKAV